MIKGYKIRLLPTPEQEQDLFKSANTSRYVWNWGLAYQMNQFKETGKILSAYDLKKVLTQLKADVNYAWLKEVSSQTLAMVLFDLSNAYTKFFDIQKKGPKYTEKVRARAKRQYRSLTPYDMNGHPKFKKKGVCLSRFYTRYDNLYFTPEFASLEKLGKVAYQTNYELPVCEKKKFNGAKFVNPRVSYINGKWVLSVGIDTEEPKPVLNEYAIGIDVGVKDLAIVSCNGTKLVYKNTNKTRRVKKLEKRLVQAQRAVSRSNLTNNYEKTNRLKKAKAKVTKLYNRLKNIRQDYTHKVTTEIVNLLPHTIVTEDLNIAGMLKNRHLAKAVQQQNLYEFMRQLDYKSKNLGIARKKADRFYPSSKLCNVCGAIKKDLKLSDRVYKCDCCGNVEDRDYNAAKNLEGLAYSS